MYRRPIFATSTLLKRTSTLSHIALKLTNSSHSVLLSGCNYVNGTPTCLSPHTWAFAYEIKTAVDLETSVSHRVSEQTRASHRDRARSSRDREIS